MPATTRRRNIDEQAPVATPKDWSMEMSGLTQEVLRLLEEVRVHLSNKYSGDVDVDDAVQAVRIKIVRDMDLGHVERIRAYLYAAVFNEWRKRKASASKNATRLAKLGGALGSQAGVVQPQPLTPKPIRSDSLPAAALRDLPSRDAQIVLAIALGESPDDVAVVFEMTRDTLYKVISRSNAVLWAWRYAEVLGELRFESRSDIDQTWEDFAVELRARRLEFAERHHVTNNVSKAIKTYAEALGRMLRIDRIPDGLIELLDMPKGVKRHAEAVGGSADDLVRDLQIIEAERDYDTEKRRMAAKPKTPTNDGDPTNDVGYDLPPKMFDMVTEILAGDREMSQADLDRVCHEALDWRHKLRSRIRGQAVARAAAEPRRKATITNRYGLAPSEFEDFVAQASANFMSRADIQIMLAAQLLWKQRMGPVLESLPGLALAPEKGGASIRNPMYAAASELIGRAFLLGYSNPAIEEFVHSFEGLLGYPVLKERVKKSVKESEKPDEDQADGPQERYPIADVIEKASLRSWYQELSFEIGVCRAREERARGERDPDEVLEALKADFDLSEEAIAEIVTRIEELQPPQARSLWSTELESETEQGVLP